MALEFRTQLSSCVLITPRCVPNVVVQPDVIGAAGGPPESVVELPNFAFSTYPSLQISYVEVGSDRCSLTISEQAQSRPTSRLRNVADAVCRHALADQSAIALGINFQRAATIVDQIASRYLLPILKQNVFVRPPRESYHLSGIGVKLYYESAKWRPTVTLEPSLSDPTELIASANFHTDRPATDEVQERIQEIDDLFGLFLQIAGDVLEEVSNDRAR